MARNDLDVNDPSLYTPRDRPHVESASGPKELQKQINTRPVAKPPVQNDYLFDGDEVWNEPLAELPNDERKSTARVKEETDNPYAKRREPVRKKAPVSQKPQKQPRWFTHGRPILYATVIIICMSALSFLAVMMMPQMAGYFWKDLDNYAFINGEILRYDKDIVDNYKQYRDYLQQDMIYQGIFVDNTYVGGQTVAKASEMLGGNGSSAVNPFSVTVSIGNKWWTFDQSNVAATRTLDATLQAAYAIGRQNTTDIIGTNRTPFRQRVDTVLDLLDHYVYIKSDTTYDHDAVRAMVNDIVAFVNREPVNAQINTFDFNTRSFSFTDDQVGVSIDGDALYAKVIDRLDAGAQNETITVDPVLTEATVTKEELEANFTMVSAFTTKTTSSSSRNTNIDLACQAINGTVLMPGETFSFNGTTGERTRDKGYKEAGAISGGETVQQVGGGVCQVSTTLFNAVARADLEVISRSPHAWPSTYVTIGEDATVDWPNLDFQFKNNKDTPVFVIMYYKNRECSAEIWGMTLGEGVSIDLDSKITKTIDPPSNVIYVQNPELAYGTSKETIKARTGYVVETYQVWYANGQETKRTLLHTSTYKAYQRTVEYN